MNGHQFKRHAQLLLVQIIDYIRRQKRNRYGDIFLGIEVDCHHCSFIFAFTDEKHSQHDKRD